MKIRVISTIIMLIVALPLLIIGGEFYNIGVYILAIVGLKEFIDIKCTKKDLPFFMKALCYAFLTVFIFSNIDNNNEGFKLSYSIVSGLFLSFLIPTILYHDRKKYSINDAFYLMAGVFFLSLSFLLLINIRADSVNLLIYLFLISTMTDTYAYITGLLIGKNKLLEEISPKKTWEGSIGGTIFGVFIPVIFYLTVINKNMNIYILVSMTLFLSIIGQFGDLVFSAIKRYFGQKDFSNMIPGHGGILDRLDSIIFILLGFMFFITII